MGMGATILDGCTVRACKRAVCRPRAACWYAVGPVVLSSLKAGVVQLQLTVMGSQRAGLLCGFQPGVMVLYPSCSTLSLQLVSDTSRAAAALAAGVRADLWRWVQRLSNIH